MAVRRQVPALELGRITADRVLGEKGDDDDGNNTRGPPHSRLSASTGGIHCEADSETEALVVSSHRTIDVEDAAGAAAAGTRCRRQAPPVALDSSSTPNLTCCWWAAPRFPSSCALGVLLLALVTLSSWIIRNAAAPDDESSSSSSWLASTCPPDVDDDVDALLAKVDVELPKDRCYVEINELGGALGTDGGGSGGCTCSNPIRPANYTDRPEWNYAFLHNLALTNESIARGRAHTLDVVMLGDSLVEFWMSTYKGTPFGKFEGNHQVYQKLFDATEAPLQGLALGVAGDKCNQLLFRIQNGILEGLYPKVFWVLIGTNDILMTRCNADQVVAGIVAIVHELRSQRPDAVVVVQSLLPTGRGESLTYPHLYAEVNQRLACFAAKYHPFDGDANTATSTKDSTQKQGFVEFVNVTQLFLTPNGTVNKALMPDGLHPNAQGAELWGNAIVETVQSIITSKPKRRAFGS